MAIEQYSGLLARIFVGFPIHFRHPRVPQNQQYGCFAFRYSAGIQSTLDTNGCLFLAACLVFKQQLRSARLKADLTDEVAEEEDEAEEIVENR